MAGPRCGGSGWLGRTTEPAYPWQTDNPVLVAVDRLIGLVDRVVGFVDELALAVMWGGWPWRVLLVG